MSHKPSWGQLFSQAIKSSKNGVYFANFEIENLANKYPCGFYQFATKSSYDNNEYKCGETKVGVVERLYGQRSAAEREDYLIVGWIPSDLPVKKDKEDQRILRELHDQKKCTLSKVLNSNRTSKEWAIFPDNNPEEVWRDYLGNDAKKFDLALTIWQLQAMDQIFSFLGEGKKKIMAELAARFGKTLEYLAMFLAVKHKIMVVGTYYLTALKSFKKEVSLYNEFSNFIVLELKSDTFQEDFNQGLVDGKKIVVLASLCGDKEANTTVRNQNAQFIEQFTDKITVIDEADYGAHTESCVPFVNRIGYGAPVILTTGTNSERAKGFHNDLDAFFRLTYLDQLMMAGTKAKIKNEIVKQFKRAYGFEKCLAKVRFYRNDWSRFVPLIDGHEAKFNPSFSKVSKNVKKNQGFWAGLYKSFMGTSSIMDANDFSLANCIEGDAKSVIQFVSMENKQMHYLESIAKSILGEFYEVHVINGDVVKGEDTEQYVNDKIRIAEQNGKQVWIIASQMCQRSFSIPEINVVILTYDNGDMGATIQKMSRALTAGDSEKIGHIISISIDGTRDDKISPMILDAAKQVADHEDIDIVSALRKVIKTLPIFEMGEDGYNIQLEADDYAKEIFSSSNSHRLVINNDRLKYEGCLDFIDLDSSNVEKAKAVSDFKKGQTHLNSLNKSNNKLTSEENQLFTQRRNKLDKIIDRTFYCIKEVRKNKDKINYQSFVNILNTNRFVADSIGVSAQEFDMLVKDRYIDLSLFSLHVECTS
jgi:hypothetical protein